MNQATLAAYDKAAASFAQEWDDQPTPEDLQARVKQYFIPGSVADIGCGSGREVGWLAAQGFSATGYDASQGLLEQARQRYPHLTFHTAALPSLDGLADSSFDNVLCETVIMHLSHAQITASIQRLWSLVKSGGVLYLSWRVTKDADQRDKHERLYAAFDVSLVKDALKNADYLLDEEVTSVSSGKTIHRLIAQK